MSSEDWECPEPLPPSSNGVPLISWSIEVPYILFASLFIILGAVAYLAGYYRGGMYTADIAVEKCIESIQHAIDKLELHK